LYQVLLSLYFSHKANKPSQIPSWMATINDDGFSFTGLLEGWVNSFRLGQ